jgi:hypothetical protein
MFAEGGFGLFLTFGCGFGLGEDAVGALDHEDEADGDRDKEAKEDVKLRGHAGKVDTPKPPSRLFPILKPLEPDFGVFALVRTPAVS